VKDEIGGQLVSVASVGHGSSLGVDTHRQSKASGTMLDASLLHQRSKIAKKFVKIYKYAVYAVYGDFFWQRKPGQKI